MPLISMLIGQWSHFYALFSSFMPYISGGKAARWVSPKQHLKRRNSLRVTEISMRIPGEPWEWERERKRERLSPSSLPEWWLFRGNEGWPASPCSSLSSRWRSHSKWHYAYSDREKQRQTISHQHRRPQRDRSPCFPSTRHDKSAPIQYICVWAESLEKRAGRCDLYILSPVSITESGGVMSAVASVLPATELSMPFPTLYPLSIDGRVIAWENA